MRLDSPTFALLQRAVKHNKPGKGQGGTLRADIGVTKDGKKYALAPDRLWAELRSAGGLHLVGHSVAMAYAALLWLPTSWSS